MRSLHPASPEALTRAPRSPPARFFLAAASLSAALTWIAFHRVLPGFFLGDDFGGIAIVRDLGASDLGSLFRMYEGQGHYRPLWGIGFWTLHAIFGLAAPGYHACALVLHALCGFALACLVARVSGSRGAGLAATAVFVVHPAHGPVLGWIASIMDPLCTLGVLLSLLAHERWLEAGRPRFLLLSLAAFVASLLVKEVAIAALPCALALALVDPAARTKRILLSTATLCCVTLGYLAIRRATRSLESGMDDWLLRVPRLVADGLGELLGPGGGTWSRFLAWGIAILSVTGLLPWTRNRKLRAACAFALAFVLLMVPQAPAFAAFTPFNTRLLHAPGAGAAAGAVLLVAAFLPRRGLVVGIAAVVALCLVELAALRPRLAPFVEAGRLSARYRDELHRVVGKPPLPSRERPLFFCTNRIPLPKDIPDADLRYFWPAFDPLSLAVVFELPLPAPLFLRADLGPGVLARWLEELPVVTQIGGMEDRPAFLALLRKQAKESGVVPDERFVLLFWDERGETLERIGAPEVVPR